MRERKRRVTELLLVVHGPQKLVLDAALEAYADDTNRVLNALHEISARVAIATGVSPNDFAAGVKHHWDYLATTINESS